MARGFNSILISMLFAFLFFVALITGGIMMAEQNGASQSIANDTGLNDFRNDLVDSLNGYSSDVSDAGASFENSTISLTSGIPFIDAIYGVWKILIATPKLAYNFFASYVFDTILGDTASKIIVGILGAILTITIIIAIIKLVSQGEG